MSAAAEHWANKFVFGRTDRPRRRSRRKSGAYWRRHFRRLLVNLSFGFLLVGCANGPMAFVNRSSVEDPVTVLRTSQEPNQRIDAYLALGEESSGYLKHNELAGLLLVDGLQKESSPLARAAAVKSMKRFPIPEVKSALREAMTDSSEMVRTEACTSFGDVAGAEGIEVLARLAQEDPSDDVRIAATRALAGLKQPTCNDHLLMCLRDKNIVVAEAAAQGLRSTNGVQLGADFDSWEQYLASGVVPENAPMVAEETSVLGKFFR